MGLRFRLCIAIITSFVICGCAPPIGTVEGGASGSGAVDGLRVEVYKAFYDLSEPRFRRTEHLAVYTSYKGITESISPDAVEITVKPSDRLGEEKRVQLSTEPGYFAFKNKGEYEVKVTYKKLSKSYWVKVYDELGLGDPDDDPGKTGGIIVIW